MRFQKQYCFLLFLAASCFYAGAQDKSERNVMLNAESATVPRELNIGLPETGRGAVVYLEDMKHSYGLLRAQYHWSGGNSYNPSGSINLIEAAIRTGEIGVIVDSRYRMGTENFAGAVTAMTSTNGLIRLDAALRGPLAAAKGWYFTAGAYINYDPTNVNSPTRKFVDQKQIYNVSLSKRWRTSSLDIIYSFALNKDNVENGYAKAPFLYNGDGSISPIKDFRIGRDCYMPADDGVSFMDIRSGKMVNSNLADMDNRRIHDLYARYTHKTESGWNLGTTLHFSHTPHATGFIGYVKGIDNAATTKSGNYTLADGTPYKGYVQNRMILYDDALTTDLGLLLKAEKKSGRHYLRMGAESYWTSQMEAGSIFNIAHTVQANPSRVLLDGKSSWGFNTSGFYFDCNDYATGLWALDDWTINDRLVLKGGIRLAPRVKYISTYSEQDSGINKRVPGFNIVDPTMAKCTPIKAIDLDYAFSAHASYRIAGRLFALTEGFYAIVSKESKYFKNPVIPSMKPVGNAFVRAGLSFDNDWMDIALVGSYITNWNNAQLMQVAKQIGGISETIPYTAEFGIGTAGVTLDGNVHVGGFKLHGLATWQDPRYKDYRCEFKFSDGSTTVIDYTGKFVTGISQWLFELDPSYQWEKMRLWASARYYSRQYASRTNFAYFDGHFETFAGLDVKVDKHSSVSLNVVNVLMQNGAKGSIDSADTVQDINELRGILMSGSYIRPFCIELGYTYRF